MSGSWAVFISSTQPTQEAIALYDEDLDISENSKWIGRTKGKIFQRR